MGDRYIGQDSLGYPAVSVESGEIPYFVGSRCPDCGDVRFPARVLCPLDLQTCERHLLPGDGVIYEVVRVMLAPENFTAPYWAGYIDLDVGVRVFARVAWTEGEPEPVSGERVTLAIGPVRDTQDSPYGPIFHKASIDVAD